MLHKARWDLPNNGINSTSWECACSTTWNSRSRPATNRVSARTPSRNSPWCSSKSNLLRIVWPFLPSTRVLYFRHFDKEKNGRLNHQEFKSCLRALGYDLPMVEEGQVDPEFETILGNSCLIKHERNILFNTEIGFFNWQISWIPTAMVTYPCKSTWPLWSAKKRKTFRVPRKSKTPSEPLPAAKDLTLPKRNFMPYVA